MLAVIATVTSAIVALPAGADESGPDCAGLVPTIAGSNAGEWITGTEGDDVIRAGAGHDTVNALGGNDIICAGPGDDTTRAGQGNDTVRSGRGNDSSSGESGDDSMRGQGDDDLADGGVGIDACFFELHEQCEADLDVDLTGPSTGFAGGPEISIYNAKLTNHGPTPAVNARVDVTLPAGAALIAGASGSRCAAFDATTVRCTFGSMGLEVPNDANIGVTFSGCTASTPNISVAANDPRTNDHVESNDTDALTTPLSLSPTCLPTAVNDAATVGHDSGANLINVLANDIPGGAPFAVGSATSAAHGSVAVTNGGANVAYTPAAGYCGPDSFTYSLTPGGSTATVSVTVPCPTAVNDDVQYQCFTTQTIPVLTNDLNPAGGGPIKIIAVTQGAFGTVTITNGGADLTYLQNGSQNDSFTYTITGGSTATVTIDQSQSCS